MMVKKRRKPKSAPSWEAYGKKVEKALHDALGQLHYRPKYDEQIDYVNKVDTLIRAGMHEGIPFAAAEIQTTLSLDDRDKMQGFLTADPVLPRGEAVRLYVEVWGQDVVRPAAFIIGEILKVCVRDGMLEDALFLRFGPKGTWFFQTLTDRIKHIDEVSFLGYSGRQNGTIVALAPTHVTVRTRSGKELGIALRFVLEPRRTFLKKYVGKKQLPPENERGLSFFPGEPDASGTPAFFAREGFHRQIAAATKTKTPPPSPERVLLEQKIDRERRELANARTTCAEVERKTGKRSGTDRAIVEYLKGKVCELCKQLAEMNVKRSPPRPPRTQDRLTR